MSIYRQITVKCLLITTLHKHHGLLYSGKLLKAHALHHSDKEKAIGCLRQNEKLQ